MIQGRNSAGFALETLPAHGVGRKLRRKNLDRNGAIEPSIAGTVDLTHPARPEPGDDFVGAQFCATCQGHE
jgi:hypothetical protein